MAKSSVTAVENDWPDRLLTFDVGSSNPNIREIAIPMQAAADRKTRITQALTNTFAPTHLEVIDETHMHAVPKDAQSHFKLLLVSESFVGQTPIQRQRAVNKLLMDEFQQGLHALSIHAWTPQQWFEKGGQAPESPPCHGGSNALK